MKFHGRICGHRPLFTSRHGQTALSLLQFETKMRYSQYSVALLT